MSSPLFWRTLKSPIFKLCLITWTTDKTILGILHLMNKKFFNNQFYVGFQVFLHVQFVNVYIHSLRMHGFLSLQILFITIWWAYCIINILLNRWFIFVINNEPVNLADMMKVYFCAKAQQWDKILQPFNSNGFIHTSVS